MKLTKSVVDAATHEASPYWDDDIAGFGLDVGKSGVKTFFVRYRPKGTGRQGPKRRYTIGRLGAVTPDEARRDAKRILGMVATGIDPALDLATARDAKTIEQLGETFLSDFARPKKKPTTSALYEIYLRRHIVPAIGREKAHRVTQAQIDKLHRHIGKTKKATANRVVKFLSGVFTFGVRNSHLPRDFVNPAKFIELFPETSRERYLKPDELERLGAALREAETVGIEWNPDADKATAKHAPKPENRRVKVGEHATAAIRLLLFTGARLREILHVKWSEVDEGRGLLLLPDSKTGKKPIFLNRAALDILRALPRTSEFVIAGDDPKQPRADLKRPWDLVSRRAGLTGVRLHDLRHSFASIGAGGSLGLPVIGALLGHRSTTTTAKYAHLDAQPVRRAANVIGATITAAMKQKPEKAKSNVVQLKEWAIDEA